MQFWHAKASGTKGQGSVSTVIKGYQQLSVEKKKPGINSIARAQSFTKFKLQLADISRNVYTVKSNENDRSNDQHVNKQKAIEKLRNPKLEKLLG